MTMTVQSGLNIEENKGPLLDITQAWTVKESADATTYESDEFMREMNKMVVTPNSLTVQNVIYTYI